MDSLLVFPGVIFIMLEKPLNYHILWHVKDTIKLIIIKKKTNQNLEVLEAQYVSPSLSLDDSLLTIVTLEKNSLHEIIDLFYKQF